MPQTPPPPPRPQAPLFCFEVLVLTVLTWISIWGTLDVIIRRLKLQDDQELLVYLLLGATALICVWLWSGVDSCALL